jgi:hypothetical protein
MSKLYRITPLEKKSIHYVAEMYRENPDGSISWFNVEDHYRWGQGFIGEDMDCNLPYQGDDTAYCDPNAGWGAELDDQVAVWFEFSEDLSEDEQQAIKDAFYEGGWSWLHDGEHEWQIEDDSIVVIGPFKVDLCEDDGTIIEENITLRQRPTMEEIKASMPEWPFKKNDDE